MPRPIVHDGQRLPASYCNFYLANGMAIVPQFGDPADAKAAEILGRVLSGRRIVPLPATRFGLGPRARFTASRSRSRPQGSESAKQPIENHTGEKCSWSSATH